MRRDVWKVHGGPELAYFRKCGDHVEGSVPVAVSGEGTRGL